MPCSPVQVPPSRCARSIIASYTRVHALALGGVAGLEQEQHVKVAVADVADDRREQPVTIDVGARVSATQSARAEIGTHTSATTHSQPGRSASAAK